MQQIDVIEGEVFEVRMRNDSGVKPCAAGLCGVITSRITSLG